MLWQMVLKQIEAASAAPPEDRSRKGRKRPNRELQEAEMDAKANATATAKSDAEAKNKAVTHPTAEAGATAETTAAAEAGPNAGNTADIAAVQPAVSGVHSVIWWVLCLAAVFGAVVSLTHARAHEL